MGEIDFENVGFGTLAIHAGQPRCHESCVKIVLTVRPFIHIIRSTTGIHTRKKQRRKEAV